MADRLRNGGDFCSAVACSNARYKRSCINISFFGFPKDETRCKTWVQNCHREDLLRMTPSELSSYKLCSDHFEEKQFTHATLRRRLLWNAVPTMFNVPNSRQQVTPKRKPPRKRAPVTETEALPCKQTQLLMQPDFGHKVNRPWTPGRHRMESHDPRVTTEVQIEIDVAEEDDTWIKQEGETHDGVEVPPFEADGHHSDSQTTAEDTFVAVERVGSVLHPQVKLELVVQVEPDVQLEPGSRSESPALFRVPVAACTQELPPVQTATCTLNMAGGCMYNGVELEPDIKAQHGVKLEPGTTSDSWVKPEPDIKQQTSSGIKTELKLSEHGLCRVDSAHNSDMNMYQCQPEVKPDADTLYDVNAADSTVGNFVSESVSLPLCKCEPPAADLSVAPESDLMTASHTDLMTASHTDLMTASHTDLMTASHTDLMTDAHTDLMTDAHTDLMTAPAEYRDGRPTVCLEDESSSQEPKSDTAQCQREQEIETEYVCELCKARFGSVRLLKQHMTTHARQKPRTVTTEQSTTVDSTCMDVHTQTDTPSGRRWVCKYCTASFINPFHFNKHLRAHRHECTECDASFTGVGTLKAHMLKSHMLIHINPQKPHKCTKCNASFTHADILKVHVHTCQKPHKCTKCNASFTHADILKVHFHTCQKPHKCAKCSARFTHAGTLTTHMLIHTDQKPYKSTECGARLTTARNLKKPVRICTSQKPHKCTECSTSFSRASVLKTHMLTHTGQEPHICTKCGATFTTVGNLRKHLLVHTGQKPHQCTVCGASFTRDGNLKSHMHIHTGQKPHKCIECGARFTTAYSLKTHIHTGQTPHECTECDACFTDRSSLNRHMLVHTGRELFVCTLCSSYFAVASSLNRHMVKCHGHQEKNNEQDLNGLMPWKPI